MVIEADVLKARPGILEFARQVRGPLAHLARILPASMSVIHVGPSTGLEDLLLRMGVPASVLDQLDVTGREENLARSRAA